MNGMCLPLTTAGVSSTVACPTMMTELTCLPTTECYWKLEDNTPVDQPTGWCYWNPADGSAVDITTASPCMGARDSASCTAIVTMATGHCSWEEHPKELFTEEFCHPIKVAGADITEAQWALCLK